MFLSLPGEEKGAAIIKGDKGEGSPQ